MAVSITIRNVSDQTRDVLAARAASSGRSLQEYLSTELQRMAANPSLEDWLAEARDFADSVVPVTPGEFLADIEADRR